MYNYTSELAGQLMLQVRAYDQTDLDAVKAAIDETLAQFEKKASRKKT
jgi:zinc protease